MEDTLYLYAEAQDSLFPVMYFDECPYQLVSHIRWPILPNPVSGDAMTITIGVQFVRVFLPATYYRN
jgi:hypothetical protein